MSPAPHIQMAAEDRPEDRPEDAEDRTEDAENCLAGDAAGRPEENQLAAAEDRPDENQLEDSEDRPDEDQLEDAEDRPEEEEEQGDRLDKEEQQRQLIDAEDGEEEDGHGRLDQDQACLDDNCPDGNGADAHRPGGGEDKDDADGRTELDGTPSGVAEPATL